MNSGYSLVYNYNDNAEFMIQFSKDKFYITARDMDEYPNETKELNDPKLQYAEVGAGLGGFVENITKKLNSDSPRPIVIDPAEYNLMKEMLEYAKANKLDSGMEKETEKMLKRVNIILDNTKVRLINLTLEKALETYRELEGSIDVVVDNFGANKFGNGNTLDYKLIKENGKLISNY